MSEQNQDKKLEELSEIEIKALLYDQFVFLEQTKTNIQVLQKRLEQLNRKE